MSRATLSLFLILIPSLRNVRRLGSTLACGLALLLAACGTSAGPTTPTPTPGRPGPAIVQIENSILARPLAGLQQASVVYEYLAEGGMTRTEPAASPAPTVANLVVCHQTSSHRVTYPYSAADGAYAYGTALGPLTDHDTDQPIKPVNVILIQVAHDDAGFTDVTAAPAV